MLATRIQAVPNVSVTSVFIFGRTTTEIVYDNYQINHPSVDPALSTGAASLRQTVSALSVTILLGLTVSRANGEG